MNKKQTTWYRYRYSEGQALRLCSGQAALIVVVFFLFISLALVLGFSAFALAELRSANTIERSKTSYIFAEGALEDALFRIISNKIVPDEIVYQEGTLSATTSVVIISDGIEITTQGVESNTYRTVEATLLGGQGASFNYGIQIGNGGFLMENASRVMGSVYTSGSAVATNNNVIGGTLISAGPTGLVDGFHATGTVYAHAIQNAEIDEDAYFQTILNSVVLGMEYPGSDDLPILELPITDSMIDGWKDAASSTVITSPCPYIINADATFGFVKFECDVVIRQNPTVTLTGPIWVEGDLSIENNAVLEIEPSVGGKVIPIVVDDPADRLTGSKVDLQNSVDFNGSGADGSYILIVSQNNSAESGGSEIAIQIDSFVAGELLLYAAHGEILLKNNISLREVTAYRVHLTNAAEVVYEKGLANLLFESGPSGGWIIDSWQEIE